MGVDAFLFADSPKTNKNQEPLAYVRESYGYSPYPSRALMREAYESSDCVAQIPAATLRERLTHVTEPVLAPNNAHNFVMQLRDVFQRAGMITDDDTTNNADETVPATVDELILARHKNCGGSEFDLDDTRKQYYDFVACAENYEKETGRPAFIYVWY